MGKQLTLYKEDFTFGSWQELCIDLRMDEEYEFMILEVSEVRFTYGEEPEKGLRTTIYREEFTDASWEEVCKDLEINVDNDEVTLVVTDIILL